MYNTLSRAKNANNTVQQRPHVQPSPCLLTPLRWLAGQVHGFRLQLWREHLGGLEEVFRQPETRDCVLRVRRLADENWRAYVGEQVPV